VCFEIAIVENGSVFSLSNFNLIQLFIFCPASSPQHAMSSVLLVEPSTIISQTVDGVRLVEIKSTVEEY